MRSKELRTTLVAILVASSVVVGGTALAATPEKLSRGELRGALLSLSAITAASGTGQAAQSLGVVCSTSHEISANVCLQDSLHSDAARSAGVPWATHLNVFSFATRALALQYVASMADRFQGSQTVVATSTTVVGFDPRSQISDGSRMETAPEVSVVKAVGANALWASCADPRGDASMAELRACATSLATAQATRLAPSPMSN